MMNHWLLNTAAEFGISLTCIFPEPGRGLNVKPIPRCDPDHYANGMLELFDSGQIVLSSKVPGDDTQTRDGVVRILDRFRALSKNDPCLRGEHGILPTHRLSRLPGMNVYFRVTARGGEAWENVARPDWSRYVSVSSDLTRGELISPNRDLLFAYLGWFQELQGQQISRNSITWQTHTDFTIVYWKRLPFVFHVSFQVQNTERDWPEGEPQWFNECRHSVQSWYTKPWNLPDWPVE